MPQEPLPRLQVLLSESDIPPPFVGNFKDASWDEGTVTLTLARPTTELTKTTDVDGAGFSLAWAADDFVEGIGQLATLQVQNSDGTRQGTLLRFYLDVLPAKATPTAPAP